MGKLTRAEKNGFGRFLHDVTYVFADVFFLSMPVLAYVGTTDSIEGIGATHATIYGLLAMIVTATLIRGGWIRPLATETLGWVSLRPSLIALRVLYYNLVLVVAVYGGLAVAKAIGVGIVAVGIAAIVGAVSILSFPRLCDEFFARLQRG